MLSYFFIFHDMKSLKIILTAIFCLSSYLLFSQVVNNGTSVLHNKSMFSTFSDGLRWGFISVLQPCLYAMFPVTVSFFLKRSQTRAQGVKNASLYSFSIVAIFTILGLLLTILFGRNTLYQISSSAVFNLFVFLLFTIFGISFLGAFEIILPASWTNKVDSKSHISSSSGIFFMAL